MDGKLANPAFSLPANLDIRIESTKGIPLAIQAVTVLQFEIFHP
jgi:hypothetical protein